MDGGALALDIASLGIRTLARRVKERKLRLFADPSDWERLRAIETSDEHALYRRYVSDRRLLRLCKLGLRLREIQDDGEARNQLRQRVFRAEGRNGLWVMEAVQLGILSILIAEHDRLGGTSKERAEFVQDFLEHIHLNVTFIQGADSVEDRSREIWTRIVANAPVVHVVAGYGAAADKAQKIARVLDSSLHDYRMSEHSEERRAIMVLAFRAD